MIVEVAVVTEEIGIVVEVVISKFKNSNLRKIVPRKD
jgi:hypothetical protein